MGLSVIAACLPTLAPIFHDLSTDKISHHIHTFLTLHSRSSSKPSKSASQTNIVRKIGAETVAMGNIDGEDGGQHERMDGHIFVTTGLSRHSSADMV